MIQDPVAEIKSRLKIEEVMGEYLQLKPAGVNLKALCPFHREKTPSLVVSREKQLWHCFGCGEGGDLIEFVKKMEGVEFPEALRILAPKAGVTLQRQDPRLISKRTQLLDILEAAERFWQAVLEQAQEAKEARAYLAQRGLTPETIETFHIGFAPVRWDAVLHALTKKGFSEQQLFDAGLTVKKEKGVGMYDRFRNRIMFPIRDVHGNTVGFSGRTLDPNDAAKYVNTPQTLVYDKSAVLFALDRAKTAIRKEQKAILVEGQMDAVSAHQAGFTNVAASSGTALTSQQIELLRRLTNQLALAFDADSAGVSAATRGIDIALQGGMEVSVILLPEGTDPDDLIRQDPAEFQRLANEAMPAMEFYFTSTLRGLDLSRVEHKKRAAKGLLQRIAQLPDLIEQTHYLQRLANLLRVSEDVLRQALPKPVKPTSGSRPAADQTRERKKSREERLAERLLAYMIAFPDAIERIAEQLDPAVFPEGALRDLYKQIIIYYTQSRVLEPIAFAQSLREHEPSDSALPGLFEMVTFLSEDVFSDYDSSARERELIAMMTPLKKSWIQGRLHELEMSVASLEQASAPASSGRTPATSSEELLQEFHRLTNELQQLS
jgi:DNA primase